MMFDVISPKGVLLFLEASKTIVTFEQCALTMNNIIGGEVYEIKLVNKSNQSEITWILPFH